MNIHADEKTLTTFHSDEYVEVIKKVRPENRANYEDQLYRFNFKEDCPVMERLYDFVISYTTGSVGTFPLIQLVPPYWDRKIISMELTGREGSIMPSNQKLQASATSTTAFWPSSNSSSTIIGSSTLTSIFTTAMESKKHSTLPIE